MLRRAGRAASLALMLLVSLPMAVPVGEASPYDLEIDNSVTVGPEQVLADRWVAQSFVPAMSFVVTRVSLFVRDDNPSDVLSVSVQSDGGLGSPAGTDLAIGSVDGSTTGSWTDIDLLPWVPLAANATYWVVARSARSGSGGYEWWNSGDDLAYPNGTAATSPDGTTWSGAGKDFSFRIYGFAQPSFSFTATPTTASVAVGQSVGLRLNFTNAGPGTSAALWVNVTLPAELTYMTDDAASIGGVRSGAYSFAFSNVAPGAYSFTVTTQAVGGTTDGTVAVTTIAFDPKDHNGAPLPPTSQDVPVAVRNARLIVSVATSAADSDPGDRITATATVTNLGSEPAMNLVLNGSVDGNATYVSSAPVGSYNAGTRLVEWSAALLNPGAQVNVTWTVDALPIAPDLATLTFRGRVRAEDGNGTVLPMIEDSVVVSLHVPSFEAVLLLNRTSAERGMEVRATLHYNNTGSGVSPRIWLNWTTGANYQLIAFAPAFPFSLVQGGVSVELTNVSSGPHAVNARFEVMRGLSDGLAMSLRVDVASVDGNGIPLAPETDTGFVELLAPTASLSLAVPRTRVVLGTTFTADVTVTNTGRAAAIGWLNLTLPPGIAYLGDNGSLGVTRQASNVTWVIPSIAPGATLVLRINMEATGPAGAGSLRFVLAYTDGKGSPLMSAVSNAVSLELVGPTGGSLWLALGILGVVVPASLFLLWPRGRVEEVFLISFAGILLAHLSRTLKTEKDRDLVSAMLTAIQDFIRDVFGKTAMGPLRHMEFGQNRILIDRGNDVYIAVVLRGRTPMGLRKRMKETLTKVEALAAVSDRGMVTEFGRVLTESLLKG